MKGIWQRAKRIALAVFRRKGERETKITVNGVKMHTSVMTGERLTDEQRRELLERLNRE